MRWVPGGHLYALGLMNEGLVFRGANETALYAGTRVHSASGGERSASVDVHERTEVGE